MPRKTDHARRHEIASRAFETIRARGAHKTTMSDIASALGMKRSTLYWYFSDLGEIFDAVLRQSESQFQAFVAGRLVDVEHPVDYLEALMRAQVDYHVGRRDHIILLFQLWAVGGSDDPERVLSRGRKVVTALREGLIERLGAGVRDGAVAPCDPTTIVDLVLATGDGALVQMITRDADAKSIVDGFCEHVLAPLRKPRSRRRTKKSTSKRSSKK
jgi:AcrR family transcriptional regulator